jgi:putative hydrolase of the HAD superfamily
VLSCQNIDECFEAIFDIRVSRYIPKPQEPPYRAVLAASGADPRRSVMVEDSLVNLHTAARLGMKTVLVGSAQQVDCRVDAVVESAQEAAGMIQRWREMA